MDYMRAGLLDRAESIFLELEKQASHKLNAIQQLLSIFQQEREWASAIEYAKKLELIQHKLSPTLLSHLHCELSDVYIKGHEQNKAKEHLNKALKIDPNCIRANVIFANMFLETKDYKKGLRYLLEIERQDSSFIPVFLDKILRCYDVLEKPKDKVKFLARMQNGFSPDIVIERYVEELRKQDGHIAAYNFVEDKLRQAPSLIFLVLFAKLSAKKTVHAGENILMDALASIYEKKFNFLCQQCGFNAKELTWNCPSCKHWGTMKPVHGRAAFSSAPAISH
jgi:lipopolysaccharide biosynthesis regulator YciM